MNVTVLFFATLKDHAGANRIALQLPADSATLDEVRSVLSAQHPTLGEPLRAAVAAINQEYAFAGETVRDGDEIAFFPPVSGGAEDSAYPEIFRVDANPIDLDALTQVITTPAVGAVCFFSGAVRGETNAQGKTISTSYLEYEAYVPMALEKMRQVAVEIREKYPLVIGLALVQRIGRLQVGEPTVLIACSSAHRDQGCFEAARYGIDRLKEIVPVWKKEVGTDGSHWVEGDYMPTPDDKRS
jgi:MoaE-MoaD fusion protein